MTRSEYTVERVREINIYDSVYGFFTEEWDNVSKLFGHGFSSEHFDFPGYAWNNLLWVCSRCDIPIGIMMARLYPSVWDFDKKVLWQDLLYCRQSKTKAAHLLLREFIDFGRANASLVFTCKTRHTNIKENSLKKLGFEKTEELFLLGD